MKITLHSNELGGLQPEAAAVLASFTPPLDQDAHPSDIYTASLRDVFRNLDSVLKELFSLAYAVQTIYPNKLPTYRGSFILMDAQSKFLQSLDAHSDVSKTILRAFFASDVDFNSNPFILDFRNSTASYRNHVRKLVNVLDSGQGRLRGVVLIAESGDLVPVCYLEMVDSEKNHDTTVLPENAFSLFRDLRYHLCQIYITSHHVAQAIKQLGSDKLTAPASTHFDQALYIETARTIAALPKLFLDFEKMTDIPHVELTQVEDMFTLSLEFPSENVEDIQTPGQAVLLCDPTPAR